IREVLAEARLRLLAPGAAGEGPGRGAPADQGAADDIDRAELAREVAARAAALLSPRLRRVVNATGILIHTNLGRAPLGPSAQEAVTRVAAGYSSLEMDMESGTRASRLDAVRGLLRRLSGCEDALAVNNNAAAVYLILHVLAAGREVIVSRGELVEIGGSFRLPEIMAASGAVLREVGTTNRTHLEDYRAAIGPRTGLILKVHPSNFVLRGFTAAVELAELVALAREHGLALVEDAGSGALEQHPPEFLRGEPRVQASLRAGADLVTASADKLLGGPQAGLILGRGDWVERCRRHPLARVVRLDKLHLAGLEATLLEYLRGGPGIESIPLYRMMSRPLETLRRVGERMLEELAAGGIPRECASLIETEAAAGGGSLPDERMPSLGIALSPRGSLESFARVLRTGEPAIVGRIERARMVLDLRSLREDEWDALPGWIALRWVEFHRTNPGD
ncbi:MAG: L-seryl-tRNA(Sec) selenium transferase, partial [Candidatus Eisenbacteria bacterium]